MTPPITSLAEQIAYDLQNAGVDVSEFNPQVSLVFWLSGFSPDPTDPFNRNNLSSVARRFSVQPVAAHGHGHPMPARPGR